jgi:hypothetical protein
LLCDANSLKSLLYLVLLLQLSTVLLVLARSVPRQPQWIAPMEVRP